MDTKTYKKIALSIITTSTLMISSISAKDFGNDGRFYWNKNLDYTIDTQKKVIWEDTKHLEVGNMSWDEAKNYCENLSLDGLKGWRLPTADELASISEPDSNTQYNIFYNGRWDGAYTLKLWSDTYNKAYSYWMKDEIEEWDKSKYLRTRCITNDEASYKIAWEQQRKADAIADEKAKKVAREFIELGKCEIGETVYHREAWDIATSSGNILADKFFNAVKNESYIIEFEGVVKSFAGKKVEVYLQDYTVKQTKGNSLLQLVTHSDDKVNNYAEKRIGKTHYFDKSRCSK
jgi:hypothetical protein